MQHTTQRSRQRALALAMLSMGILLVVLAKLLLTGLPATIYWTEEDNRKRLAAASLFQRLSYSAPGTAEHAAARERHQFHEARLRLARSRRRAVEDTVYWLGVGMTACGTILWWGSRKSTSSQARVCVNI